MFSELLDQKLNPLIKRIEDYNQQQKLSDIIGGLGYILGITGIATYFLSRKKRIGKKNYRKTIQ